MEPETENKKSIFIVDDDKFLNDMYSVKFREQGFEVYTANDGPSALKKVDEGVVPDIFLVDVVMPEMDGFELVENLKQRPISAKKIIIVLSNLGQKEDVEKGLAVGADGYIVKASATPSEVVSKVLEISSNKM